MSRRGFTLVEVSVCLLVIAVIAGIVTVRWRGAHRQATAAQVTDDLVTLDSTLRQRARLLGEPCTLRFDERDGGLTWTSEAGGQPVTRRYDLGTALTVTGMLRIAVTDGEVPADHTGWLSRRNPDATSTVPFTAEGTSPTYGWMLRDSSSGQQSALVFAGLTGQWRMTTLTGDHASNSSDPRHGEVW